jgi:hypothetical protein
MNEELIKANKIFFEVINLGAVKVELTFKLERKSLLVDYNDPRISMFSMLYPILANIA